MPLLPTCSTNTYSCPYKKQLFWTSTPVLQFLPLWLLVGALFRSTGFSVIDLSHMLPVTFSPTDIWPLLVNLGLSCFRGRLLITFGCFPPKALESEFFIFFVFLSHTTYNPKCVRFVSLFHITWKLTRK